MTRCRPIALFAALLIPGPSAAPDALAQQAVVEGVARAEEGGAPVPFALVRLIRADSSPLPSDNPPQGITNAEGRYRFDRVAPGRYRVELVRIGFRPWLSDPVQVGAGQTIQFALRVASQLVMVLPPVTVTADICVPAKEFKEHPQLQTLWQQARDGASVRTELMARFRYTVFSREESVERKADGTPVGVVDQRYLSDPKWAVRDATRNRTQRISRGYYGPRTDFGDGFYVPSELDVLHEDFLRAHCFVAEAARGEGEVGLRFRPLRLRRNFLDIGGTIWLDSATYLARRIELEYVDGEDPRGTVRIDYSDVAVAGGTLRMPVGGEINLRPSRRNPANRSASMLTITYSGFEEVPRR